MSWRFVHVVSFTAVAACSSSSSSTPAAVPDASDDALQAATDPSCRESSFSQTRPDPPTGACVANAVCRFSVNNGVAGCDGGATSYPVGAQNWVCTCESDERWNCDIDPSTVDAGEVSCP